VPTAAGRASAAGATIAGGLIPGELRTGTTTAAGGAAGTGAGAGRAGTGAGAETSVGRGSAGSAGTTTSAWDDSMIGPPAKVVATTNAAMTSFRTRAILRPPAEQVNCLVLM
jgi:hypothetical protein